MSISYLRNFSCIYIFLIIIWQFSYVYNESYSNIKWEHDLFSISDLHSDLDALKQILLNEKIIDEEDNAIRRNVLVVITGDVLDPTYDDIKILYFIQNYNIKAKPLNSQIQLILGNHEVKNICLDFSDQNRYVKEFEARNNLFKNGEMLYNYLLELPFIIKVNDILFSHASIMPYFAKYGIDEINNEGKNEIKNNCELFKLKKRSGQRFCVCCLHGPTFNRYFARARELPFRNHVCKSLSKTLKKLNAKKLVNGHTIQRNKKVNEYCKGSLILADTGISKWKYGVINYIQHFQDGTHKINYINMDIY
ncbi:shewanella-like protein phosphatase 2 [Plasmodium sp. gorilla clade G2]|uniref:shewanella-like protein phosphatase 2 n=1 Tax=Plasmodium sp. gorilla clade G2 TaxID=880535 RepID=UPI000D20B278|nr:shewanella-like protein phosphatase 2 [Plasmodium sp. gorilla clade G2]SOV16529.1 shewanella-like protein phosphatase 2 [Plasmodium sp. gorilla clade G2]